MNAPTAPTLSDFRFRHPVEIRFRDLDAMGHVNNAVYITYFENARVGYMKAVGHWPEDERSMTERFPFIMLKIECQYLAPATIGDDLRVCLRTSKLGEKSFHFDYLVVDGKDKPIARGHSVQVFYDYSRRRTMPMAGWFRDKLIAYEGDTCLD